MFDVRATSPDSARWVVRATASSSSSSGGGGSASTTSASFSHLPNEVAELVLGWLGVGDVGAALLVCRRWADIVSGLPASREARALYEERLRWGLRIPSRRLATRCEEYRIAVTGVGGVGRCAFTQRYMTGVMVIDYDPIIDETFDKVITVDGVDAKLELNVSAGQEEFNKAVEQILVLREAFVVMYSVTSRSSFEQAQGYLKMIHRVKDVTQSNAPPVILLGNKVDLLTGEIGIHNERVVSPQEGQALADRYASYAWGTDDGYTVKEYTFHFTSNFFECSVLDEYLVEYPLLAHRSAAAYSPLADGDDEAAVCSPAEAAERGAWEVHRGLGLVIEELVRQTDMWRHVVRDGGVILDDDDGNVQASNAKKDSGAAKRCLLA